MRKFIVAMMASSALAMMIPVIAQAHDNETGVASAEEEWNNGGATYQDFDQEYQHIWQGIQHGLSDGSYTQREAYQFYREMRNIRARASWEERQGYYAPEEIQARLERLHQRMHTAHERGHDRLDRYNNNDRQDGNYGYHRYRYGQ